jgi:hypothetical protein
MIIEFVDTEYEKEEVNGPVSLVTVQMVLIHFDPTEHESRFLEKVSENIHEILPKHTIVSVPYGQPCPTNPQPKIAIANRENPALLEAIKELYSKPTKPGEIRLLSSVQMKATIEAQANGDLTYF